MKVKCTSKSRSVTFNGKKYSFSLNDIKELPDDAVNLIKTPFFKAVEITEKIKLKEKKEDDM